MKKLALIFSFVLLLPFVALAGDYFSDVPASHPNSTAIYYMKEKFILKGYEDGTFRPENAVNRAELMKIIVESNPMDFVSEEYDKTCFTDTKQGQWFTPYICYARAKGWVSGYKDGTFGPEKKVTKAEAIKMVLEAYGFYIPDSVNKTSFEDVKTDDWFAIYVERAYKLTLIDSDDGNYLHPNEPITRAGISQLIYNVIMLSFDDMDAISGETGRGVSGELGR